MLWEWSLLKFGALQLWMYFVWVTLGQLCDITVFLNFDESWSCLLSLFMASFHFKNMFQNFAFKKRL